MSASGEVGPLLLADEGCRLTTVFGIAKRPLQSPKRKRTGAIYAGPHGELAACDRAVESTEGHHQQVSSLLLLSLVLLAEA